MENNGKICATCQNKRGKTFTAPISRTRVPVYSCTNYRLSQGYDCEKNSCVNYISEKEHEKK